MNLDLFTKNVVSCDDEGHVGCVYNDVLDSLHLLEVVPVRVIGVLKYSLKARGGEGGY